MNNAITKERNILVGTIPRSGTNLILYFFAFYELFQQYPNLTPDEISKDKELLVIFDDLIQNKRRYISLGIDNLLVGHAYCPGFSEYYKGDKKVKWENIPYEEHWWNALGGTINKQQHHFFPQLNKDASIVFLFRNPLDVIVSLHRHLKNHKATVNWQKDIEQFCKKIAPMYVKSYFSYLETYNEYPDNIHLVKYEDLMNDRMNIMRKIFEFIKLPVGESNKMAFQRALIATDKEAMKVLEKNLGRTLANDQSLPPGQESHIRGGEIGRWRDILSDNAVQYIESTLNNLDFSLDDFILKK